MRPDGCHARTATIEDVSRRTSLPARATVGSLSDFGIVRIVGRTRGPCRKQRHRYPQLHAPSCHDHQSDDRRRTWGRAAVHLYCAPLRTVAFRDETTARDDFFRGHYISQEPGRIAAHRGRVARPWCSRCCASTRRGADRTPQRVAAVLRRGLASERRPRPPGRDRARPIPRSRPRGRNGVTQAPPQSAGPARHSHLARRTAPDPVPASPPSGTTLLQGMPPKTPRRSSANAAHRAPRERLP